MAPSKDKPIRILLVDDEADLVEFLAARLLKRGFTVAATTSGDEALRAVNGQIFDVAVLDLKMPRMDGIELLAKINEIQPFLEAIMLTGHGSTETALAAGRLKAFKYLMKPYDTDDLIDQILEASQLREQRLEAAYMREMETAISPGHSPQDILARGEELRRKYERD